MICGRACRWRKGACTPTSQSVGRGFIEVALRAPRVVGIGAASATVIKPRPTLWEAGVRRIQQRGPSENSSMAHSFTNLLYHIVFATKGREPWLIDSIRPELLKQLGILIKEEGGIPLIV